MEIVIAGLFVLLLCLFVVYDHMEITALKYGMLKAMATQSKDVDSALKKLLTSKDDCKILNRDFKKIEQIYLTRLNSYLIRRFDADPDTLRREILKTDDFEL